MAPRGKNNPLYRTKEQLIDDVFNILMVDKLSVGAKHAVIFEATWLWTEHDGKYTGCAHWSKKALDYVHEPEKVKGNILIHDHVVPRNLIIKRLLFGEPMSRNGLHDFLDANLVGGILLKEENGILNKLGLQRKMPNGWEFGDRIWARYKMADFEIYRVEWNGKISQVKEKMLF